MCCLLAVVLSACESEPEGGAVSTGMARDAAVTGDGNADDLDAASDAGDPAESAEVVSAWASGERPSCGEERCGDDEPCCGAALVPAGSFPMGRCGMRTDGCSDGYEDYRGFHGDELPEHPVSVSAFYLDSYEATVARFRSFVAAYDDGYRPVEGAGAHPRIAGSGWREGWEDLLPATGQALERGLTDLGNCDDYPTWTHEPGDGELRPINCVGWLEAFAFCVWDGGRLPSEAEWEMAAAGGDDNRRFPWGEEDASPSLAIHGCEEDGDGDCALADLPEVGSRPAGAGRWGHQDLAGSVEEWVFDWYDAGWYGTRGRECMDCARVEPLSDSFRYRGVRGGSWMLPRYDAEESLRAASRSFGGVLERRAERGLRCARSAPP